MKIGGYRWLCATVVLSVGCDLSRREKFEPEPKSGVASSPNDARKGDSPDELTHGATLEEPTSSQPDASLANAFASETHRPPEASSGGEDAGNTFSETASPSSVSPEQTSPSAEAVATSREQTITRLTEPSVAPADASVPPDASPALIWTSDETSSSAPSTDVTSEDASSGLAPGAAALDAGLDAGAQAWPSGDAETPALTSLQFFGAHTTLYPAFDPARKRYSVIAESDDALLSVVATATPGSRVEINGKPLAPGEQVDLVDVRPGTELVVSAEGEHSEAYFVQYLPTNFPNLLVQNPTQGATHEPLYLSMSSSQSQYIAKLDDAGVPLFYRGSSSRVYDFKKHHDGTMSYAERRATTKDGSYRILLNSDFEEIGRLSAIGLVNTDVHDFLILPNGNHVFLSYEPTVRDLSGLGLSATQKLIDSIYQETTPEQAVIFQWNSWDHVQYEHSVHAFRSQDYAHANSVEVDHDENWLFSLRGLSQVVKVDRVTGEVIWRLGGIANDFTFVSDPYNGFCGQHTASRLENGHILIFDNARECQAEILGSRPDRSRVVEYALDEVNMTAELVWSYERDGLVATAQGSAQRLSNGNTMIGWGMGPRVLATEVTPLGDVAYELTGTSRNGSRVSCYRARKFAD